ncbi:malate dehydrogenase, cytoplasmic [Quercus suber]|uniref:malate dehydrogenase, cytoplasmic n=1 Tax=Quercus suber TaxID=58331 RepID=UPI0032DE4093
MTFAQVLVPSVDFPVSLGVAAIEATLAQGQIDYAIVPMIARGIMLGPDQPVILHLLDIEQAAESLNGIRREMTAAAFPLLKGVVATTDIVEVCKDVNIAVMLGGYPRKEITLRKDMLSTNVSIYKAQHLFQRDAKTITPEAFESVKAAVASSEIEHKAETKKKVVPHKAVGQAWEDPTLADWPKSMNYFALLLFTIAGT